MSTICHYTSPTASSLSSISASVCIKQVHRAQWQALFSESHKQHRGQTLFILPLSHSLLSPFSFCLHFLFSLPALSIALRTIVSLWMRVLWSRISKCSINLRWALRLQLWQLRISCCSYARACCVASRCFGWYVLLAWPVCLKFTLIILLLCGHNREQMNKGTRMHSSA